MDDMKLQLIFQVSLKWLIIIGTPAVLATLYLNRYNNRKKAEKKYAEKLEVENVKLIGKIVRWAIYVFAALAILLQLGITPTIINSIVIGLIGMISLAFGLAFAFGLLLTSSSSTTTFFTAIIYC